MSLSEFIKTLFFKDLLVSIDSVPTFNFYKDGDIVDAMFGANVSNLEKKLNNLTGVQEREDEAKQTAVEEKELENDVVTSKEEPAKAPEESTPEESEKASNEDEEEQQEAEEEEGQEEQEEGEKRDFTLKVLDLEGDKE